MFHVRLKNLILRHFALAFLLMLAGFCSPVAQAQGAIPQVPQMNIELYHPVMAAYPMDMSNPASPMQSLGNIPAGTILSMQNPYAVTDPQTQSTNLIASVQAWFRSMQMNPYPTDGSLAYVPMSIGSA